MYKQTPEHKRKRFISLMNRKNELVKKIIHLYESGLTQTETAKILKITQKSVCGLLKRRNYKCRIAFKRNQNKEKNDNWKGEKAGYTAKHKRLYTWLGKPKKCNVCGLKDNKKRYEWANLTGNYDNPKDYERMCKSCHMKYDFARIKKLKNEQKNINNNTIL